MPLLVLGERAGGVALLQVGQLGAVLIGEGDAVELLEQVLIQRSLFNTLFATVCLSPIYQNVQMIASGLSKKKV